MPTLDADVVTFTHLSAHEQQLAASAFITRMLAVLAGYTLLLAFFKWADYHVPTDSLVSFAIIIAYLLLALSFMRRSNSSLAMYGITLEHWPHQVMRGFVTASPILVVVMVIKEAFVLLRPGHFALFEPMRALHTLGRTTTQEWLVIGVAYIILTFAQEFVKCAIQRSLEIFYRAAGERDKWKSILISTLTFSASHVHLSEIFAVVVFLPGIYWGWLFRRENSFLTTAVSHALIGFWIVFVIGVSY